MMPESNDKDVKELSIGDLIYSPKIGIGTIKSLESVERGESKSDFFFVESENFQTTLMVPVKSAAEKICRLENPQEVHQALEDAKEHVGNLAFESKKDRVKYFQDQLKSLSFSQRLMALKDLNSFSDKGKVELQIFQSILKGLSDELQFICGLEETSAREKIHVAIEI